LGFAWHFGASAVMNTGLTRSGVLERPSPTLNLALTEVGGSLRPGK
jgi:hypothetical protein